MAARGDNAPLRAAIAALAAVAALLAFVIWQGAATSLRSAGEAAREESGRAATLAVARAVETRAAALAVGVTAAGRPAAAALYAADGARLDADASTGGEAAESALPERAPEITGSGWTPERVPGSPDAAAFALRLADGRTLVVATPVRETGTLGGTLAAYEALTLVVVLAAIGLAMRRLARGAYGRFEPRSSPAAAASDGPQREAEFVVETFQTVIGELQVKGRRLELESLRERERAERSERFSERVIAQMPTGLVVVDRTGRVTAANASARDLFADLPRARTDEVDFSHAFRDAGDLVRMVAKCLRQGATFARREIEMRGVDGASARCLGVSVSPISPGPAPEAALCLMTDLTEVVELRDRLRLQETMASLGEMAAGLTHELKNSLATIQGYGQLIATLAPEVASESADDLVEEVGHLSRMVTDFLNFARPQEVARAPVAVDELVVAALERLEPLFEETGVAPSLTVEPEAAGVSVLGDETLLGRALLNVVQNAAEALATVPEPRTLAVTVSRAGDDLVVSVVDNGPGISDEDLSKIFIPFFTTRSRGHGIGLALTQKIVLAHGGRIAAERPDSGAAFRVVLPVGGPSAGPHA